MNKELIFDEVVVVGDDIFFTATNESCLYSYNFITRKICKKKELSITAGNMKKFISMVKHNNKIWIIPLADKFFRIYDVAENTVEYLEVPKQCIISDRNAVFRRAVYNEKYIWLIPNYSDCILQINMETKEYKLLNSWPIGVDVKKDMCNFKSASYYNGKLYLFRDNCSSNIIIDVNDGSMRVWDLPVKGEFGLVKDGKVIVSPIRRGNTIRIFSLQKNDSVHLDTEIGLEDCVWGQEKIYAFWYMDYIGNKVFILPHEANVLLILDITSNDVKMVNVTNCKHNNFFNNNLMAVESVLEYGDDVLVVSYVGNQLVFLDRNNDVKEVVTLSISEDLFGDELRGYIDGLIIQNSEQWENEDIPTDLSEYKGVGHKIYTLLTEGSLR